jgi:hypothetical protein
MLMLLFHVPLCVLTNVERTDRRVACSLGLSATSQQYFTLRINQPPATNQPAVLFSQNKPASATSHQPNEQAGGNEAVVGCATFLSPTVKRSSLAIVALFGSMG